MNTTEIIFNLLMTLFFNVILPKVDLDKVRTFSFTYRQVLFFVIVIVVAVVLI